MGPVVTTSQPRSVTGEDMCCTLPAGWAAPRKRSMSSEPKDDRGGVRLGKRCSMEYNGVFYVSNVMYAVIYAL